VLKGQKDILAGLIFAGFGIAFAVAAWRYDIGTALRMGPGYFPLVLGAVLALLGAAVAIKGLLATAPDPVEALPWRSIVLITLAVVLFGLGVRPLGLAPALFGAVLLAAFSSRRAGWLEAVLVAGGLTLFCILVFIYGLGLPVPLLGPWLAF
jgi:hypothetical protein